MSRIVYRLLVLAVAAAIPALSLLTRPAAADPGDRRKPSDAEILRQLANYRSWNIVKKSDNGIGVSLSTFEIKEPTFYGWAVYPTRVSGPEPTRYASDPRDQFDALDELMSSSFFIGRSPALSKGSSVPPDDIPLRDDRPVFNSRFDAPFALNGSPKPKNDHRGLESWARVYVNDAAFAVMKLESPVFPEGSIIVREKLPAADADAPELVTAMLKHGAGFSPKTNDWEFVVVDRNFTRLKQRQRSGSCFECHAGARQSDLVFKTYLR